MKKIKVLFLLLTITFMLSFFTVNADFYPEYVSYVGVNIPRLSVPVTFNEANKIDPTRVQEYFNSGTIDNCSGSENGIKAKLKKGSVFTSEITISSGLTSGPWGNDSKDGYAYAPRLRTNTSSLCASTHSGIWYHY